MYDNYGTRYFYFGDENFFFDKKRAIELMDAIKLLKLDITVGYQTRIKSIDEELISKAAESGMCTEIQYGVESGSQEILDLNKKGLRIEKVVKVLELTKKYGINTHCYFLVGLPGETQDTAMLTISTMKDLLNQGVIDFIEYRCAVPFPGTPMRELAAKFGVKIKHNKWEFYRGENEPPFDLKNLSSTEIYNLYLSGLKQIAGIYKQRYRRDFGDNIQDINVISAVTEGGF